MFFHNEALTSWQPQHMPITGSLSGCALEGDMTCLYYPGQQDQRPLSCLWEPSSRTLTMTVSGSKFVVGRTF